MAFDYGSLYRTIDYSPAFRAPQVDFVGGLGGIANQITSDRRANQAQANRDQSFAEDQRRDTRDFGFRESQAGIAQRNTDRSFDEGRRRWGAEFGLKRELADRPDTKVVEGPDGTKVLMAIDPRTGGARVVQPEGFPAATEPGNPYNTGTKEAEAKEGGFARRMFATERDLRALEAAGLSNVDQKLAKLPFGAGNYMVSDKYRQLQQAKEDWVNASLRRESGAVISPDEFTRADRQYFPQPGDDERTLAMKRRNRAEQMKGIAGGAGPRFRVPYTFDDNYGIVDRAPAPPSGAGGGAGVPPGQGAGAPRASVQPPAGAVQALRSDPRLRADFDAKYGAGASDLYLGQR